MISPKRQKRPSRAMALISVIALLFFVLGIAMLGTLGRASGLTTSADAALRQISAQADAQIARDLADTGVRITYSWLLRQDTVNNALEPFAPSTRGTDFYGASVSNGYNVLSLSQAADPKENAHSRGKASTIRVRIYPGTDPTTGHQLLTIQSIGQCGDMTYTSRLTVRPKSFAEYGLFYDEALSGFVWMAGMHVFTGPVHLNMRKPGTTDIDISASHTIIWDIAKPLFTYPSSEYFTTTAASSQIIWLKGLLTPLTPLAADWPFVATFGAAPKFDMPLISFPSNTNELKALALYGTTAPTSVGVTVPHTNVAFGGIFVTGDVSRLTLSTSGNNNINQLLTFHQTSGGTPLRTVVTLDRVNGLTQLQSYATVSGVEKLVTNESYSGVTNGVVYIEGNVGDTATLTGGISGTIANSASADSPSLLTIALPETKTLQFEGSVVYQRLAGGTTANPVSTATQADDLCGIAGFIAGKQWIVERDSAGNEIKDIAIHGALLTLNSAGGTAPSAGCTNYATRPAGKYYHLGALAMKKDGPFGQFWYDALGNILAQYGFNRQRLFDTRLLNTAPPFFPVTDHSYRVVSFQSGVDPLP